VSLKQQRFEYSTQDSIWRGESHKILHQGGATIRRLEIMVVAVAVKKTSYHRILKIAREIVGGDAAGVADDEAKVPSAPGDLLPWPNQS